MSTTRQEKHRIYQRERAQKRISEAKLQLGNRCAICGSQDDLQFDHIDPSTKNGNISTICNWSEVRFQAELAKCQLLCQTCHTSKTLNDVGQQAARHGVTGTLYRHKKCRCGPCVAFNKESCRLRYLRKGV